MTDDLQETALDRAHRQMEASPDDALARLYFYELLAEAELILMLAADSGETVEPALFDTGDGRLALVFDSDERLAAFTGTATACAVMPGRVLIGMLNGKELGIGLNLGVAPSSFLMPPAAVDWLADVLTEVPAETSGRPASVAAPNLDPALISRLDRKLARAEGLASHALLAAAKWEDDRQGHLLAIIAPADGAEPALARAIGEAVTFSGYESASLEVAFFDAADPMAERLAGVALRFDLPVPASVEPRRAPGTHPQQPPRLR